MTATTRYKYVKNTLGVPFTADNFINKSDGDDKQYKQIKRVLTAADIGATVGKTQHANGCILEALPDNYKVINFSYHIKRPFAKIQEIEMVPYLSLDNVYIGADVHADYLIGYAEKDNTMRIIDQSDGDEVKLKAGDEITIMLTLGVPVNADDKLNG